MRRYLIAWWGNPLYVIPLNLWGCASWYYRSRNAWTTDREDGRRLSTAARKWRPPGKPPPKSLSLFCRPISISYLMIKCRRSTYIIPPSQLIAPHNFRRWHSAPYLWVPVGSQWNIRSRLSVYQWPAWFSRVLYAKIVLALFLRRLWWISAL